MSSLLSRSVVLALARLTNYLVLLLSPILLVRILEIEVYGQYREFILYALLAATILAFSVGSNILYFVAKDPEHSPAYISNSVMFLLITSTAGLALVYLLRGLYEPFLSFDYSGALVAYVFFFLNLDLLESIWLATKQARLVFIYSAVRTVVRMTAVVSAAMISGDIMVIIYTMIAVEAGKFLFLLVYMLKKQWLRSSLDVVKAREQFHFLAPLAVAAIIYNLNQRVGNIFVSTQLGAVALAIYSIGVYQIPIIGIVRSAVADAIFPEMVEKASTANGGALDNWKQANVVLVAIVMPIALALIVHASVFVEVLFTSQYLAAAPIFQVTMLLMIRQCFELGSPLRAANATRYFFRGNFYALVINLVLVSILVQAFGSVGAIVALLMAEIYLALYLARQIMKVYGMLLKDILAWRELSSILMLAALSAPLLTVGWWVTESEVAAAVLGVVLYLMVYLLVLRALRIPEVDRVYTRVSRVLKKRFDR